jgi:hypothetical protein
VILQEGKGTVGFDTHPFIKFKKPLVSETF